VLSQTAKCLGVSESALTKSPAIYDSPDFSDSNNNTVSSTTGYRATDADQIKSYAIFSSPKAPDCLSKAFTTIINEEINHPSNPADTLPQGVTLGAATVSPMSFPTFGDRSIALRTQIPVSYQGLNLSYCLDLIFSIKGRADVGMQFLSTVTPFPADQEEHYTGLIVSRLTDTA
jgi:hypothetical protein